MKKVAYDKYYQDPHYFGESYPEMIAFFLDFDKNTKILDLGCGQGRDAITLAKMGYDVTGIDHSKVGIDQMLEEANKLNLTLKGIIADIYKYNIPATIDMVLMDSMLHFYKKDLEKERQFLSRIISEIRPGGYLCNFIIAGKSTERQVKKILAESATSWEVIHEGYATYNEFNATYHMFVAKKLAF